MVDVDLFAYPSAPLHHDVPIMGGRSYGIHSFELYTFDLAGILWQDMYSTAAGAPSLKPALIATTWGTLKRVTQR